MKQRWYNVLSTLCNVFSTLFQRRALTLYQCCVKWKIQHRILLYFQRRIDIISTLIHNVETTLIWRWNNVDLTLKCWVGLACFSGKLLQQLLLLQLGLDSSFCLNSWRLDTLYNQPLWSRYEQLIWGSERNEYMKTECGLQVVSYKSFIRRPA